MGNVAIQSAAKCERENRFIAILVVSADGSLTAMTRLRFQPAIRKEIILQAAVITARRPGGWSNLTRQAIAKQAQCSEGLVSRYLGNMCKVRKAIMKVAIRQELIEIIVQSIAASDGHVVIKWLPASVKHKTISSLFGK